MFRIERINIMKMSILPKAIYRFNAIPTRLLVEVLASLEKKCKIYMGTQKTLKSQKNVEKEKQSWKNQAS